MPALRFPTAAAVLRAARSQVGVTENPPGSNHTIYGDEYGQPRTYWCGHFVWWCFNQAGVDLRRIGIPHPQFTPSFFTEAAKAGWVRPADTAIQAGDVLFFDFRPPYTTSGIQHVGIATGPPRRGIVPTIEGNTTSGPGGPQDNGGGVFERHRGLDVIVAVVRAPYAGTPTRAAAKPATSSKARTARNAAAAVAVAGAVATVGNAAVTGPTAPTAKAVPSPAAAAPARPSARPTPSPTATPHRTPRRAVPAPRRPVQGVIVGPLRSGSTGESVKVLQRHLGLNPTGYFGRATLRKVRAAQAAADIPQDGVVGPTTTRAMGLPYVPANRP